MVRIKSVRIRNFGPYIDETMEFPQDDGVCFVWGENGSGKTTLLNIFKYAFFGTLFDGKYKQHSKAEAFNKETDERFFGVTLNFESNDDEYELSRFQHIRDGVAEPRLNVDFKEELILIRNGVSLSKDEAVRTLNQLMPADISQFFFFDSERLSVFEKLMDEEDSDGLGQKVKESIEKILGIPVLKNCLMILNDIISDYDRKISKAVMKDDKSDAVKDTYKKVCFKLDNLKSDLITKEANRDDLFNRAADLEEKMKSSIKILRILERKRNLETQLDIAQNNLARLKDTLREHTGNVWISMLTSCISDAESAILPRYAELDMKVNFNKIYAKKVDGNCCPLCQRPYDDSHPKPEMIDITEEEKEEYRKLSNLKNLLDSHKNHPEGKLVMTTEGEIRETDNRIYSLKREIEDCNTQIGLTSEEEKDYEDLQKEYVIVQKKLDEVSRSIKELESQIKDEEAKKENALRNMEGHSSSETAKLRNRQAFYKNIAKVLERSIETYCESMKANVERDATEFFLKIDKSGFYSGLKINDNYGLGLVDTKGRFVPAPSTGYQHMMALSLIRGIHCNAPVEGPAIVDYLFGHIDENHQSLVAQATPYLAKQVIVLAFKGEFDEQELRSVLSMDLLREFRLVREDSFSTRIEIH